jgi:hypothetical protein
MYLIIYFNNDSLELINIFHNEKDKLNFEAKIKADWDVYLSEDNIRQNLRIRLRKEIEAELAKTVDLPKIPFIKNPELSDKYADAFRGGRLKEASDIMDQIRGIGLRNGEIRLENLKIDRINNKARENTSVAREVVLAKWSEEDLRLHNQTFDPPIYPMNVDIIEIDINNFTPVVLKSEICDN